MRVEGRGVDAFPVVSVTGGTIGGVQLLTLGNHRLDQHVSRLSAVGEIPSLRLGRRVFIPKRALSSLLAGELQRDG